MKSLIEYFLDNFVKTNKDFRKIYEVNDAEEIIKMKTNGFEAWSTIVFMRGLDKRKYGELIHDFSIKYTIKKNQNLKTLKEVMDFMRKVKFKAENNNDKINTQKSI